MPSWFNPRIAAVAISIVLLVQVSKVGESRETIRRGCFACLAMFLLYAAAFLAPIARTLGVKRTIGPGLALLAGWTAVALALIADALPRTLAEQMHHRFNWPMATCCVAGSSAFLLFFQSVSRSLRLRAEVLEARHSRRL